MRATSKTWMFLAFPVITAWGNMSSKVSWDTCYEVMGKSWNQHKCLQCLEMVALQVSLKAYDPQKDKHFLGTIRLKSTPHHRFSMCVLWGQQHCEEVKAVALPHMGIEVLRKLRKNKELVKKLAKKYDDFLASESLIKQIPWILGPGLSKSGKFPSLLTHNENIVAKVDEVKSTIRFQMKKVPCLAVTIGHLTTTDDEAVYCIVLALNFLVSLLKKHWQNVRALCLKSTCTKAQPNKSYSTIKKREILGCFWISWCWSFHSHQCPTHTFLGFPSYSSWFDSFIYFKVQFVIQLEETVSKGESNGKFIFFLQRVNRGQVGDCWHGAYWIYLVYFFLKSFPLRGRSSSFLFKCKAQSEKNLKFD